MAASLSLQPFHARPADAEHQLAAAVEDLTKIHGLSLRLGEVSTLSEGLMDVLRTACENASRA